LSWYSGHTAYNLIKIKDVEEEKKKEEGKEDAKAKKERAHKEVLQMVISSNLLSGGIEDTHLPLFSQDTKDKLTAYALLMDDQTYVKGLSSKVSSQPSDETF
jgi:hypothetical protein